MTDGLYVCVFMHYLCMCLCVFTCMCLCVSGQDRGRSENGEGGAEQRERVGGTQGGLYPGNCGPGLSQEDFSGNSCQLLQSPGMCVLVGSSGRGIMGEGKVPRFEVIFHHLLQHNGTICCRYVFACTGKGA